MLFLSLSAYFLPSFFFVALISRFVPLLRKKWWSGAFLDGVNVSALGLMVGVTWTLGRDGVVDWFTIALTEVQAGLADFRAHVYLGRSLEALEHAFRVATKDSERPVTRRVLTLSGTGSPWVER
jgi:hypothetical protein